MSFAQLPAMLISETEGWSDIAHRHPSAQRLLFTLVMPMSLIPPVMYAYAERMHPGAVFPLSVPALTDMQLLVTGFVLFAVQLVMVSLMATLIRNIAVTQDHDPDYQNAYALAAIAPVPLWLSSLALFVPSLGFNVLVVAVAWAISVALIRHGVRPLLQVADTRKTHTIADLVILTGVAAWIGLMILAAALLSLLIGI
ncbi:MAG: Yip1 family protein [Bacteroidota bacterium]